MPDETQTNGGNSQKGKNKNKVLQSGIKGVLWGGGILLVGLLILTFALPSGRILFFASGFLSLATLVVIALQSITYSAQWKAMDEGLAIERAKTNPRLRVEQVRAENFEVGQRPIYIVTIANDGLIAATGVRIHMGIEIDGEKPMEWVNHQVVTIPANGREHYFIHSSFWLSQEQLGHFNDTDSLRVVGLFEYWPVGITNFCFKYLSLQGERRPPQIPQFVPCDFTPRLITTIRMGGAIEMKGTVNAKGVVIKNPQPQNPDQKNPD